MSMQSPIDRFGVKDYTRACQCVKAYLEGLKFDEQGHLCQIPMSNFLICQDRIVIVMTTKPARAL